MTTPEQLAARFAQHCAATFPTHELTEICRRNALPEYRDTGCCATHDFCDANMLMLAAFEEVTGRSMPLEADHALWNAAWQIATTKYLTATPKEKP